MSTEKKTDAIKPSKKGARKQISSKLEAALPELKQALGEKKFMHRLKKAVKILSEDFTATLHNDRPVKNVKTKTQPSKKVKKAAVKKPGSKLLSVGAAKNAEAASGHNS